MPATIEGKISFVCPSCAAHLQVPGRLAGVTGPCPKCGATLIAPKQSSAPEESASQTASHHDDPGAGNRSSYTSLRRRRTPVETPIRSLKSVSKTAPSEEAQVESDSMSEESPFSHLAKESSSSDAEETSATTEVTDAEVKSEEASKEVDTQPILSSKPSTSVSLEKGAATQMLLHSPSISVPTPAAAVSPAALDSKSEVPAPPVEKDPAAVVLPVKAPINLTRSRTIEKPESKIETPSEEVIEDLVVPFEDLKLGLGRIEDEPKAPAQEVEVVEPVVDEEEATVVPEVVEQKPKKGEADSKGFWPWQKSKPVGEVAEEAPPALEEPAAQVEEPQAEAVSIPEEKVEAPVKEDAPLIDDDFEWLMTKEGDLPFPSELPPLTQPPTSLSRPLVDLEEDLDQVISRRDDGKEAMPAAPGPFPKWNTLEGAVGLGGKHSPKSESVPSLKEVIEAKAPPLSMEEAPQVPDLPEKKAEIADPWVKPTQINAPAAGQEKPSSLPPALDSEALPKESPPKQDDHSIPVALRSSSLRDGLQKALSSGGPLSARVPSSEKTTGEVAPLSTDSHAPEKSEPWMGPGELTLRKASSFNADAIAATPWLAPQPKTEVASEEVELEKTLPPSVEEKPPASTTPPSLPESPPELEPVGRLPRFLGGVSMDETPPPVESKNQATNNHSAEGSISVEGQAGHENFSPVKGLATPPMLGLQTFGEGEPPRPGERATAPSQRISLPQISGSNGDGARAIVSPVTKESVSEFAPLDSSGDNPPAAVESTQEAPPVLDEAIIEAPVSTPPSLSEIDFPEPPSSVAAEPAPSADQNPAAETTLDSRVIHAPKVNPIAEALASAEFTKKPENVQPEIASEPLTAKDAPSLPVTPEVISAPASLRTPIQKPEESAPLSNQKPESEPESGPLSNGKPDPESEADDFGFEDEGMAKVLGLIPRGKDEVLKKLDRRAAQPKPGPRPEEKAEENSEKKPRALAPVLPSIDEILERSTAKPPKSDSWTDKLWQRFEDMDGSQRKMVYGGAAGVVVILLTLGMAGAGLFGGSSDNEGSPDSGSTPETSVATSAAENNPPAGTVSNAPSPQPAAPISTGTAGTNKLVIMDSGAPPEPPAPTATPVPVTEDAAIGNGPKTGVAATEDPKSGAPVITSLIPDKSNGLTSDVAWAGEDSPGAQSGTSKTPEATKDEGDGSEALILPMVGGATDMAVEEVDPFIVDGSPGIGALDTSYTEIGGAGTDAEAPTGTPVSDADTSDALKRQESKLQSVVSLVEGSPEGQQSAAVAEPPVKKVNLDDPLEASKDVLNRFLAQTNWKDRMPYIYQAEKVKPRIEAYYQNAKDGAITESVSKFFDMDEKPVDGGDPFYAFYLYLEGYESEFPVVIRKTSDGYKVDWELFIECKDRLFADFKDSDQNGPATFRLVMQRHSYWGADREEFTTSADYNCYKVEPPYPGAEAFVFVAKDSAIATEVEKISTWGLPSVDVVLTLERKALPHGVKHLMITKLDKPSWVAP